MPNTFRTRAIKGFTVGDSVSYTRRFTREQTLEFGDMTRDYNPVHYDERWSDLKGFKGLICHGLLVGSMICEFGGQAGWLATGMDFKFLKPVYFGDCITCTITITRMGDGGRAEAEARFINQNDQPVCHAALTGRLPVKPERELLERMVVEEDPHNKLSNETYEQS